MASLLVFIFPPLDDNLSILPRTTESTMTFSGPVGKQVTIDRCPLHQLWGSLMLVIALKLGAISPCWLKWPYAPLGG